MNSATISYKNHSFQPQIIARAVWLSLSLRLVEEMLLERGVVVSYETIRRWSRKFNPAYAKQLRRKKPSRNAGGRLVRFNPSGGLDRTIDLPVTYPTCCCFGGVDMSTLFVTSASEPLSPEERAREPLAGRLFAKAAGVSGRPEYRVGF